MSTSLSPPQSPSDALPRGFWFATLLAACLPTVGTYLYFDVFAGQSIGKAMHLGIKVFEVVFPPIAIFILFRQRHAWFFAKGAWERHKAGILPGIAIGLGIVALGALLFFFTPLGEVVLEGSDNITGQIDAIGVGSWYLMFALVISIAHSALEEYYWRFFVYGNLAKAIPVAWAHVLAGVAFMGHHIIVLNQFFSFGLALFFSAMVGVGGVIWSLLYQKQRSLMGAWISHMIVDFGIMAIGYWMLKTQG